MNSFEIDFKFLGIYIIELRASSNMKEILSLFKIFSNSCVIFLLLFLNSILYPLSYIVICELLKLL